MAAIAGIDMARLSVESLAVIYDSNDALAAITKDLHTMLRIYFVSPATTCSPERSFSALKRIKTYIRTTMTEARLNHCATLQIHKSMSKTINIQKIVDNFIARSTVSNRCIYTGSRQQITNPKKSMSSILKYEITIAEQTGKRGHFLEMIYQMLLTVPPTSVEAYLVFSSCAYLYNRFRSRLGDTTLDSLCFIRNNRS